MTLIDEYFELREKHRKTSGDGTIVLVQVGSFFEAYGIEENKLEMTEVCNILSMQMVRRDGKCKNQELSRKNPYMAGFPEMMLTKNVKRLVAAGYIVAVYHQTGENASTGKQNRELLGVYSPGTFVNDSEVSQDGTTLVGVWVEELEQLSGRKLPAMGFASIDLSSGRTMVHESYAKADEPNLPYEELIQLAQKSMAREVVIRGEGDGFKTAASCFEIEAHLVHDRKETPKDFERVAYQNEVLEKIFGKRNPSAIEDLGLHRKPYALKALIMILEWAYEHVNVGVKGLQDPETVDTNRLILGNSAIYQLNILENSMLECNVRRRGIRSLFDVVNNTCTIIGRRYLKRQLTNPLIDSEAISARHNSVEILVKNEDLRKSIGMALTTVMDLERLHRRMVIGTLGPTEFNALHASYDSLLSIRKDLGKLPDLETKWLGNLRKIVDQYSSSIHMSKLGKGWNVTDIRENLFVKGTDARLDAMDAELHDHVTFMRETVEKFSAVLDCKLELVDTDRDGYLIRTTKIRGETLRKIVAKSPVRIGSLTVREVTVKAVGTACRITFPEFTQHGEARRVTEVKMATRMKKLWMRAMSRLYKYWETELACVVEGASEVDFLVSAAKTAVEYNYCRPKMFDAGKDGCSSIDCKQMRHPIIEQLTESTYVPHDLALSGEGILLFGANGAGKSSSSKAMGLNIVLAQCGMFVACKSMKLVPYKYLFARITGNDNILRGLSSFAVEMLELKAILKHANKHAFFVGDEVCRGTTHISGTAIVAAAVEQLSRGKASFIFATHLHDVATLPEIVALKNVRVCHIHSSYNKETGKIVYDRDMRPGQGDKMYGLVVASDLLQDTVFMNRANYFAKQILKDEEKGELVEKRKSKWNSDVYMTECTVCQSKENLNVHHIRHRAKCTDGYSDHVRQDSKGNLVVLCRPCHDETHAGAIEITGWMETTKGRELQWVRVEQVEVESAISKIRDKYERSDWTKDWAHSDAVKKLGKKGHHVTADQVRRIWLSSINNTKPIQSSSA